MKLVYFPVRAKAECIRMALRYGKIEFKDVSVSEHFGTSWGNGAKDQAPFGQLPLLLIDGEPPIAQSGAIMRYVSKLAGLAPANDLDAAKCDMIFEASQELATGDTNVNPIVNVFRGEQFEQKKATYFANAPTKIANLAKQHEIFSGEGPFFFGAKPLYCDLSVYHVLENTLLLESTAIDGFPVLQTFMDAVKALPGVAEYLAERPQCVDIGVAPMLKPI